MSSSNCCFLTCMQVSQEACKVVWYSLLFKIFPQFVVIHTIKGFNIVNEAKVDIFLKFSCFFYNPTMLAIWTLVPLPFLNPVWTSGSSQFTYCLNLARKILSMTLLACEISTIVWQFEHSLALPFFGIGMKTDIFRPCSHFWVPNLLAYWVQHFHGSSFRIWNPSTGILSCLLALFIVMLPKVHLTSHSWMFGSRWMTTSSWLSRSLRTFFYVFFCLFLPPLLNRFYFL